MPFASLGLKKEIIQALSSLQITTPVEVQQKVIPLILQKRNVVFTSPTGSGKTLAYTLGFLSRINKRQGLQMIIMTPTRELCIQVGKAITKVCQPLEINVGMLFGGRDIKGDYKTITKKNQIMVATPGRLIQHVNDKAVPVGEVKYLIYDESDQMFDQGFYDECAYLKQRVSKEAQIVLSSATITGKVSKFVELHIDDYELLHIGSYIPKNIKQEKIYCAIKEKNKVLLDHLDEKEQTIIFCNTKMRCEEIASFLKEHKIKAKILTGNLDQKERNNHLNLFKNSKFNVLVTTDVAARGLHMEHVKHVINYDVPTREEFYVHRIGRTGRGDKEGKALTLICPEDEQRFNNIATKYSLEITEKKP